MISQCLPQETQQPVYHNVETNFRINCITGDDAHAAFRARRQKCHRMRKETLEADAEPPAQQPLMCVGTNFPAAASPNLLLEKFFLLPRQVGRSGRKAAKRQSSKRRQNGCRASKPAPLGRSAQRGPSMLHWAPQ